MKLSKLTKTILFCFSVAVLTAVSFLLRNILIDRFNGYNFKLFSIDHINNYGAAFSILQNQTGLLITISLIILILALIYVFKNIEQFKTQDLAITALLSSGISGNLTERILDGFVTDYFKLNFVTFPVFNIFDLFICIGAFVLICNILFNDERTT